MKQTSFLPDPPEQPRKPDAEASAAGRALRARRRDALAAGHSRAQQAGDHADRELGDWIGAACELALQYGRGCYPEGFLMEEARVFAHEKGLPQPPDARAWGSVTGRLKRGESGRRIEACGFATDNFGSPKTKWRVA